MKKIWFALVAGLLAGAFLGALLAQRSIHQRQNGLAVMWLLQLQVEELQGGTQLTDCAKVQNALQRLSATADELAKVFPLANAQDPEFHKATLRLAQATKLRGANDACSTAGDILKEIRAACADCHRDYR